MFLSGRKNFGNDICRVPIEVRVSILKSGLSKFKSVVIIGMFH